MWCHTTCHIISYTNEWLTVTESLEHDTDGGSARHTGNTLQQDAWLGVSSCSDISTHMWHTSREQDAKLSLLVDNRETVYGRNEQGYFQDVVFPLWC